MNCGGELPAEALLHEKHANLDFCLEKLRHIMTFGISPFWEGVPFWEENA